MTSEPAAIPGLSRLPSTLGKTLAAFLLDIVLAIIVMMLTMVGCFTVWAVLLATTVHGEEALKQALGAREVTASLVITVLSTASAALMVYFWRRPASAEERVASMAALRKSRTWLYVVGTVVAVLAMTTGITMLGEHLGIAVEPSNLAPLEQATAVHPVFTFIFAVFLAPVYEEVLCRRVLFGRLWAAGWPKLGMLLSGAVFASMHEVPGLSGHSLTVTMFSWLPYALMGIAFAWVYKRTGTLGASIATHALNNAVAMLALNFSFGGS